MYILKVEIIKNKITSCHYIWYRQIWETQQLMLNVKYLWLATKIGLQTSPELSLRCFSRAQVRGAGAVLQHNNKLVTLRVVFLEGDSVHFRVQILPRHQDQGQEVSLLYKYQRLTDGIIRSGKEEFPVHATRLAESSHVVANMLLDLSDEFSISHKVDLSVLFRGFSSEVIFQLLCHVYNPLHQIGTLRHVQELAELAQKLFMPGLQGKIIKFITENYQLMKAGTGKIEQDETHVLQILQLSERFRWCDVMIVCEWVIFQQGRVLAGNNNINSKVQERILRIQGNAKAAGKQLKEINLAQYIANCKKIYENYAL
eukprot:TRINITY_DN3863_c0_g1_i3.p2 TRINITY_DN3863_c0_g1~~TRINITY_DN3863_c0_g1_i3.p2  ORF type:complete len:314 (+),score=9.82 TRINITY_DN3863_c0_g1_i3:256-1197(+)